MAACVPVAGACGHRSGLPGSPQRPGHSATFAAAAAQPPEPSSLTVAEQGLGPFLNSGRGPSAVFPVRELRSKEETSSRQAAPAPAWGDHFPALLLCILPK